MERERHLKNLKKIAILAKNKKNTYTKKINLGKNLICNYTGYGMLSQKCFLYTRK